jgi:hypothetical protein
MAIRYVLPAVAPGLAFVLLAVSGIPRVAQADPGDTELVSEHYSPATAYHSVYLRGASADGRYVVFITDAPAFLPAGSGGLLNVLVRDRSAGTTTRANLSTTGKAVPTHSLEEGAISADGRYVAFVSRSDAVVPGDTNGLNDIFLRDLRANTTELVSLRSDGQQYRLAAFPSLSADGRYVAFIAADTDGNGFMLRVRDRLTQQTSSRLAEGLVGAPIISANGRYLVYRNYKRIVALDLTTGRTDTVNVSMSGQLANDQCFLSGVSADGRFIAFHTPASNLVPGDTNGFTDVFVRDRKLRITERVSLTDDEQQYKFMQLSVRPSISGDGRFVAFHVSTRHVGGFDIDDIFVRDRAQGRTRIASVNSAGVKATGHSSDPVLNEDGRFVAFVSEGANLAPGDANHFPDVFVHEFAVTGSPAAALALSPDALGFGSVAVGSTSATKTVRVTNAGTTSVAVSWIGLAGESRNQFSSLRQCPGTLAAGASCTAEVVFTPTSTGAQSARLVVSINDGALRKSVAVSGTGL